MKKYVKYTLLTALIFSTAPVVAMGGRLPAPTYPDRAAPAQEDWNQDVSTITDQAKLLAILASMQKRIDAEGLQGVRIAKYGVEDRLSYLQAFTGDEEREAFEKWVEEAKRKGKDKIDSNSGYSRYIGHNYFSICEWKETRKARQVAFCNSFSQDGNYLCSCIDGNRQFLSPDCLTERDKEEIYQTCFERVKPSHQKDEKHLKLLADLRVCLGLK